MGIILFNLRDLQRLERRIDKVQKEQAPPTLRMIVLVMKLNLLKYILMIMKKKNSIRNS